MLQPYEDPWLYPNSRTSVLLKRKQLVRQEGENITPLAHFPARQTNEN